MRDRIIYGSLGVVLLVVLLLSDTIIMNVAISAVSFLLLLEVYNALNLSRSNELKVLGLVLSFGFTFAHSLNTGFLFFFVFLYIVLLFLIYMIRQDIKLSDISAMFFITFFICMMLSCIVFVRKMQYGALYVWLVFLAAYVSDTFAYFFGRFFGRNRPFKNLSPNKSIEGCIAGVAFVLIAFAVFGMIIQQTYNLEINYVNLLVIAFVSSIMGQFGDLAASRIKREHALKDFSGLIPGHGGIMDRLDSVLFTAPTIYVLLQVLPFIM